MAHPDRPIHSAHIWRVLRVWSCAPRAIGLIWKAGKGAVLTEVSTNLISGLFPLAGLWATKRIIDSVAAGDEGTAYLMIGAFALFAGLHAASGCIHQGLSMYMEARIPT